MRFDIAFFLCCCRSFLSSSGRDEDESFYDLLGVTSTATPDELKRAYKRQSLLMHPDKLAQKGQAVTPHDRDRFTRMRHAYEVLSDPRRKETYDAIGERGMKWIEEPLSVDPQELAHNFATSSICDRSKIFAIFLVIYVAVFLLPILVCLMADGNLGQSSKWVAILTPLWIWDVCILFYHSRVIMMGQIKRPEHIPEEDWVDPLPIRRRIMAMVRFGCLVLFQILLALQLDGYIRTYWSIIFIPMYLWDIIALRRKIMIANISIVTHDELELAIGRTMAECTPEEREDIHYRYIVVPKKSGSQYDAACRLCDDAKMDIIRILARIIFIVLLVLNLDLGVEWSWWLVFLPIFGMALCIVGSAFRASARTQAEAMEKAPGVFGVVDPTSSGVDGEGGPSSPYAKMDENKLDDDEESLSDQEKEELKAKVAQSSYRAVGTCASQCFFIVIVCIIIGKIEGAGYSSLAIISPFLAAGGIILCCLACTIFCISEVDENAGMMDFDTAVNQAAAAAPFGYGATAATEMPSTAVGNNTSYTPPRQQGEQSSNASGATSETSDGVAAAAVSSEISPPSSTWDPERGEVWQGPCPADEEEKKTAEVKKEEAAPEVQPAIIEENPSMVSVASSQFDLD